jgi:thiamine-monophosphate kinase
MIDLSDGIGKDLGRMLAASGSRGGQDPGVELDLAPLERLQPLADICRRAGLSPASVALDGGEDYELCFTIRPGRNRSSTLDRLARKHSLPFTRIGRVVERPGLWQKTPDGVPRPLRARTYEHFEKRRAGGTHSPSPSP